MLKLGIDTNIIVARGDKRSSGPTGAGANVERSWFRIGRVSAMTHRAESGD